MANQADGLSQIFYIALLWLAGRWMIRTWTPVREYLKRHPIKR